MFNTTQQNTIHRPLHPCSGFCLIAEHERIQRRSKETLTSPLPGVCDVTAVLLAPKTARCLSVKVRELQKKQEKVTPQQDKDYGVGGRGLGL